ncbi:MAG: PhoD-like phosphatase N-terminal domain-containing protein, partial [Stackebrandtia sp.]
MRNDRIVTRRSILGGGVVLGGAAALGAPGAGFAGPALREDRPRLTHGVLSGDVSGDTAVVWTRADRGGQMWVEWSTRPDFADATRVRGPKLLADNDYTAKARLRQLPSGETVYYRAWADDGVSAEPATGSLRTTPATGQI